MYKKKMNKLKKKQTQKLAERFIWNDWLAKLQTKNIL